ncbi:DMT family transporter [Alteromonas sp. H39]|uniref:DMT family transporter n=1 Tax=Alteromonas sp. H39 TaxID=3389876 RepID=UPI0039E1DD55
MPSSLRISFYTMMAMIAFAANSLLCRMALVETDTSPGMFTAVRLLSGAITLLVITRLLRVPSVKAGSWRGALALSTYAAAFSFAYVSMSAGTGALLLFGSVQITMISAGLLAGERFHRWQVTGFIMAIAGLIVLLMPGLSAPPFGAAALMLCAGFAWGIYSIMGRGAKSGTAVTSGNFVYSLAFAAVLLAWLSSTGGDLTVDNTGLMLAIASGAIASGVGYALWYQVLPHIRATNAATIQLSVPVLAVLAGWLFLSEAITLQIVSASFAILGGIAVVIRSR